MVDRDNRRFAASLCLQRRRRCVLGVRLHSMLSVADRLLGMRSPETLFEEATEFVGRAKEQGVRVEHVVMVRSS